MSLDKSSKTGQRVDAIDIQVRVRYCECDPMGVVHHSIYPQWFEMARIEMLRRKGRPYDQLEAEGIFFVVARMQLRYRKPAKFDDLLRVHAWVEPEMNVKVEHHYEVHRGEELLCQGDTTLVCVNREGRPMPVPPGVIS